MTNPALAPLNSDSPEPAPRAGAFGAFGAPRILLREGLAGLATALALVPEVISFSFVAGVDPKVSLLASVVLGVVMSVLGGRSAMVTAAAGSVALVIGPMVRAHGVEYVLPAVLLAGAVQIAFGAAGFARALRWIPRSVMNGFVNALGVLIFWAQIQHVTNQSVAVYALLGLTLAIVCFLPRFTSAVPSPLVAIAAVTILMSMLGVEAATVGVPGAAATQLPGLTALLVPLTLDTLRIVAPTALSIAFVGLLESLLTAKLVDELTATDSNKTRESWALGVANLCAGLYGGVAGCAMIGQTVVNVQIGRARTRLSTFVAALALLLFVTVLSPLMARIPMIALAGIMMVVAMKTVDWRSVHPRVLKQTPIAETSAMLITVAVTVWTDNLAIGVLIGLLAAVALFAHRVACALRIDRVLSGEGQVQYRVHGPVFFGNSGALIECFSYTADPPLVSVDFSHSQIWDVTSVLALDAIRARFRDHGVTVCFAGLDPRSSAFYERLGRSAP
ncbi:MAG TPA: SulP family inorganic anion transporter [Polyangiaceae bacterium]